MAHPIKLTQIIGRALLQYVPYIHRQIEYTLIKLQVSGGAIREDSNVSYLEIILSC